MERALPRKTTEGAEHDDQATYHSTAKSSVTILLALRQGLEYCFDTKSSTQKPRKLETWFATCRVSSDPGELLHGRLDLHHETFEIEAFQHPGG